MHKLKPSTILSLQNAFGHISEINLSAVYLVVYFLAAGPIYNPEGLMFENDKGRNAWRYFQAPPYKDPKEVNN